MLVNMGMSPALAEDTTSLEPAIVLEEATTTVK
jgi:hypothetical protein